jgi:hypothetical protein
MKKQHKRGLIGVRKLDEDVWMIFKTQEEVANYIAVSRPMVSLALNGKFVKTKNTLMGYEICYVEKKEVK